jgi:hypothetical protein
MRRPFRERVVAQARPDAAAHDLVGMTIGETANRPGRATVVLVHGGFLGAWIWEDVASLWPLDLAAQTLAAGA